VHEFVSSGATVGEEKDLILRKSTEAGVSQGIGQSNGIVSGEAERLDPLRAQVFPDADDEGDACPAAVKCWHGWVPAAKMVISNSMASPLILGAAARAVGDGTMFRSLQTMGIPSVST
jgi:hypothetical protein